MPARTKKRPLEDEVFTSKAVIKQVRFPQRAKTVKDPVRGTDVEPPRKRRKSQTTITQLDFGKRSYLDAICDSDEGSMFESDAEATPKPRSSAQSRRRKLPEKTESQDTLTQFVKRASGTTTVLISDSEDDACISEIEDCDTGENDTKQNSLKLKPPPTQHALNQDFDHKLQNQEPCEVQPPEESSPVAVPMHIHLEAQPAAARPPRTPRRVRVLPVPSSRSPPDTNISTQITPVHRAPTDLRSPLLERSTNTIRTPKRLEAGTPSKASTIRVAQKPLNAAAAIQSDSLTKRRVREFNARFAMLEKENSDLRKSRGLAARASFVPARPCADETETQYPVIGDETQDELMGITFTEDTAEAIPDADRPSTTEMPISAPEATGKEEEILESASSPFDIQAARNDNAAINHSADNDVAEEVLIPSSQTRKSRSLKPIAQMAAVEESLPESTYNSSAGEPMSLNRDTQDLASDQLMRETQAAFIERIPSSPFSFKRPLSNMVPLKSSPHGAPRPSQATTVDETMTHSSPYIQRLNCSQSEPVFKIPDDMTSSSSPMPGPDRDAENHIHTQIVSSPVMHPPDLTDVPSSPKLPEPKTPSLLRNLRVPLQLTDLISDSLDQSLPMPPAWRYDDDVEDEEEDDDEL